MSENDIQDKLVYDVSKLLLLVEKLQRELEAHYHMYDSAMAHKTSKPKFIESIKSDIKRIKP